MSVVTILFFIINFNGMDNQTIVTISLYLLTFTFLAYCILFYELIKRHDHSISDHIEMSHSLKNNSILAVESDDFSNQDVFLLTENENHIVTRFDVSYLKRIAKTDLKPNEVIINLDDFCIMYSYDL